MSDASAPPNDRQVTDPKKVPSVLHLWWRLMETRIGIVPMPIFLAICAIVYVLSTSRALAPDILVAIALLTVAGFASAEIGKRIPGFVHLGAPAIFATFLPSYLVFAHWLPMPVVKSITDFTKQSNFLYLFICVVIVGSILGMDRRALIDSFLKIFLPLALSSLVAAVVGTTTGLALGLEPRHTFFYIVIPIMAGGVGEGALPLSAGYVAVMGGPNPIAEILPAVMLGSLVAIIFSGILNRLGASLPGLTGNGRLSPQDEDAPEIQAAAGAQPDPSTVGAAMVMMVAFYLCGVLSQVFWHWPGPIVMLVLAVAAKLCMAVPASLELGAIAAYRFFRTNVTYPLLFAIGVTLTPWKDLVAALTLVNIVTITATVGTMMTTAFVTAKWCGLYPIDTAIVCACHCGQGGTGSVAILTASNRMRLMPFAQIATRVAGAIVVSLALLSFSF